jgi:hypothetical protein
VLPGGFQDVRTGRAFPLVLLCRSCENGSTARGGPTGVGVLIGSMEAAVSTDFD